MLGGLHNVPQHNQRCEQCFVAPAGLYPGTLTKRPGASDNRPWVGTPWPGTNEETTNQMIEIWWLSTVETCLGHVATHWVSIFQVNSTSMCCNCLLCNWTHTDSQSSKKVPSGKQLHLDTYIYWFSYVNGDFRYHTVFIYLPWMIYLVSRVKPGPALQRTEWMPMRRQPRRWMNDALRKDVEINALIICRYPQSQKKNVTI